MGTRGVEFDGFLTDLMDRCSIAKESQFDAAENWDKMNLWLGMAAAGSGVIGGISATGTGTWGTSVAVPVAAVASTLAGILAATNSFLKPAERAEAHKRAGDGWSILLDRIKRLSSLNCVEEEKICKEIESILQKKEEITKSSPVIPAKIHNKVRTAAAERKKKLAD
jgi:hypothetical protein